MDHRPKDERGSGGHAPGSGAHGRSAAVRPPGSAPEQAAPQSGAQLRYGDHPDQHVEVLGPRTGPDGRSAPVAVLLHGGFWRAALTAELMRPLAADLAGRGWRVWNVEYRRTGDGGGWPRSLEDVRTALGLLGEDYPDGSAGGTAGSAAGPPAAIALGHSAGGHLALLAAPGSPLTAVAALAPVTDLVDTFERGLGEGAAAGFLGADPSAEAFSASSPLTRVPIGLPTFIVHGEEDQRVPLAQSRAYVRAAREAGDTVTLHVPPATDHFALIDPDSAAWRDTRAWMADSALGAP
ncbi:alpha/beta hydrolase family protein [Nocardiopsis coralliicola]